MSHSYKLVQWNAHKQRYDLIAVASVVLFIVTYVLVTTIAHPSPRNVVEPVLVLRALGACAVTLLHVILAIGPLHRIWPRTAPLLYNRRHLGVLFFFVCGLHAFLAIGFYGGFGIRNPVAAVLSGYDGVTLRGIPFEIFGFAALVVFGLMAATSHDFWLKNLSPKLWKWLHMLVYPAYVLVFAHVMFGAVQSAGTLALPAVLLGGVIALGALHTFAALRSNVLRGTEQEGWVRAGSYREIAEGRAAIVEVTPGEEVAVFKDRGALCAVSNTCAHQGGPLGEGAIVDGCITCPWHGYQYKPGDGTSPPPYDERLPTYDVRIEGDSVLVRAEAHAPGTPTTPARPTSAQGGDDG